jgi:hypothetical protein
MSPPPSVLHSAGSASWRSWSLLDLGESLKSACVCACVCVCVCVCVRVCCRAWACASSEKSKRRTVQKEDIHAAIQRTDVFDFLVPIVVHPAGAGLGAGAGTAPPPK